LQTHAGNRYWNQLVLSNKGKVFLLKETTGAVDAAQTHNGHITSQMHNPLCHATIRLSCSVFFLPLILYCPTWKLHRILNKHKLG